MSAGPRWDAGMTVALLAGAAGVVVGNTAVFLSSVVGFGFAAYHWMTHAPELDLAVSRDVSERSPRPGRSVTVTLAVENESDSPVADLRIVDGVPERLGVVSGSPRRCTSLGPGEQTTLVYEVRARRGSHAFDPVTLLARDVSGSHERREERAVGTTVTCEEFVEEMPLRHQTASYPGHTETDAGGEGLEFHSTREYRPADPISRIDWKRFARTRELTTVNFRESRAATVLVVVDTRVEAAVARREGEPDAVELARYATGRIASSLVRRNDRVGVTAFGAHDCYLAPRGGRDQVMRIRTLLSDLEPSDSSAASLFDGYNSGRTCRRWFDDLRRRTPADAQVVFVSPLADDDAIDVVERFDAYGHRVTVVCPDVTGTGTAGGKVVALERSDRTNELRSRGIRVVDWSPDEPLRTAVETANVRWSA